MMCVSNIKIRPGFLVLVSPLAHNKINLYCYFLRFWITLHSYCLKMIHYKLYYKFPTCATTKGLSYLFLSYLNWM